MMKKIFALSAVVMLLLTSVAYADREAPKAVPPVVNGNIEYRAPHDHIGCVEAWQGKDLIWRRQVYVVKYNTNLVRGLQNTYITTMELKGNTLVVQSEKNSEYHLDLKSLEVKVIKGSLIHGENALEKERLDRNAVNQAIGDRKDH